jgi:hypothetical protein
MTQACESYSIVFPPPTPPTSFLSPGGLGGSVSDLTFPRDVRYVIAAPVPATIYYTLDGTTPMENQMGTMSAPSPVALGLVPGGTTISWFADYGSMYTMEAVHTFTAATNATSPTAAGCIAEEVNFAPNNGPGIVVGRGGPLALTLNFQAWEDAAGGSCPGCPTQFVVSVQSVGAIGCVDGIQGYGAYPGEESVLEIPVFYAPPQPGRFPLVAGITHAQSCDGTTATGPEIGEIFAE